MKTNNPARICTWAEVEPASLEGWRLVDIVESEEVRMVSEDVAHLQEDIPASQNNGYVIPGEWKKTTINKPITIKIKLFVMEKPEDSIIGKLRDDLRSERDKNRGLDEAVSVQTATIAKLGSDLKKAMEDFKMVDGWNTANISRANRAEARVKELETEVKTLDEKLVAAAKNAFGLRRIEPRVEPRTDVEVT